MTDIAESAEEGCWPWPSAHAEGQLSAESPLWMFASSTRIKPKPVHIGGYARGFGQRVNDAERSTAGTDLQDGVPRVPAGFVGRHAVWMQSAWYKPQAAQPMDAAGR